MLEFALDCDGPVAIRYPRGSSSGRVLDPPAPIERGKSELLRAGSGVAIFALGNTVDIAMDAYALLESGEYGDLRAALPTIYSARFVAPLDREALVACAWSHDLLITLEEHSLAGGFGSAVLEALADAGASVPVERIGVGETFLQADTQARQRSAVGLDARALARRIAACLVGATAS